MERHWISVSRPCGPRAPRRRHAFRAYCACDDRAQIDRESYLSHFWFGPDLDEHMTRTGSEKGFVGLCEADLIYWDIDKGDDLDAALNAARRLAGALLDRYRELDDDDLLILWSGSKGLHVAVPTSLWGPPPSTRFHETARRFCQAHAERAGIVVDPLIYSKCRLFRSPNSKHPGTGLRKRRIDFDELMSLSVDGIIELARHPKAFEVSRPDRPSPTAAADWLEAGRAVERRVEDRRAAYRDGSARLTKTTLAFIRDGAPDGERAIRLFQAAANLGEFDCPPELAHALLSEAALDSGLTPGETKRQVDCGLAHAIRQREAGVA